MTEASQLRLQIIFWYLLSICAFVAANSNNTCEVLCLCSTPPDYWNQLKCCPESLVQKEVANPHDVNSESNSPFADYYPMSDGPMDSQPMYSNPAADDYPLSDGQIDGGPMYDGPVNDESMWDRKGDGRPMYDSLGDGGPIYDSQDNGQPMSENPSSNGPMFDSRVAGKSPVSPPSLREPRSLGQGKGIRAVTKRNHQVKISHKSSCVSPLVYTEPLHKDFAGANPFRVFHDCPQKFIGSDVYLKCQNFRNVSSLDCMIPVVDRKTKIIYANRFCAECNGIDDFETFHHEFKCSNEILGHWDLLSLEQTEENKKILLQSGMCVYSFKPPDKKTMQAAGNRCLSAKYTKCYQAEDVVLSNYVWDSYKITLHYLEDGKYCALCGYESAMLEYPDIGQSTNNTVQGACNYGRCLNYKRPLLSYSFFI